MLRNRIHAVKLVGVRYVNGSLISNESFLENAEEGEFSSTAEEFCYGTMQTLMDYGY